MNFISWMEGPKTQVELKYCERCGGLWLRPQGDSEVYCGTCRLRLAEMPRSLYERPKKPRLPRPKPQDLHGQVQIEYLQAVTEREVRA
jgi:hypothetical protein